MELLWETIREAGLFEEHIFKSSVEKLVPLMGIDGSLVALHLDLLRLPGFKPLTTVTDLHFASDDELSRIERKIDSMHSVMAPASLLTLALNIERETRANRHSNLPRCEISRWKRELTERATDGLRSFSLLYPKGAHCWLVLRSVQEALLWVAELEHNPGSFDRLRRRAVADAAYEVIEDHNVAADTGSEVDETSETRRRTSRTN